MVRPERRTKTDIAAAAVIVGIVIVCGVLTWWHSDARATSSRPATGPPPNSIAAPVPDALTQLWTADSPASSSPVVVAGTVVTGAGREVHGRDPASGAPRWSYTRGSQLCALSWVYRYAVAVYPDRRGCGQVSSIDAGTGRRGPARSSYADPHVTLTSDDSTVLSTGTTRLELWRSDLVRVLSYGEIDARVKPSALALGTGCTLLSASSAGSAVSALELCPGEAPENTRVRLTLLHAGKEDDEPEPHYLPQRGIGAESGARVLAVADASTGTYTAVYLPELQPRVEVVDQTGSIIATTLLPTAASPQSATVPVSRTAGLISWWTGDTVVVFDAATLTHRYTVTAVGSAVPLGPAAAMSDRLLIPVRGGVSVHDLATGQPERIIAVSRPAEVSTVVPRVSGSTLLEQRGDTLAALG